MNGAHRATRARPGWRRNLVVLVLSLVLGNGLAWAFWSASTTLGSNGAAAATAVNQGSTPTAVVSGANVTVSWAATTLTNGQAVTGYQVTRFNASNVAQTMLSACAGTIAALTCTENSVPAGTWTYSVTPRFGDNWLGVPSGKSAPVTLDTTAPVNAITLSNVTGGAYKNGTNTVYYKGNAAGSFTLTNTLTDAGSGPASSQTAALGGTSTGWSHTPSTVSTPTGGPYVSNAFSWTNPTTSAPTEVVTGLDVAGNATPTTLTFTNDSTNPTVGSISYADGYTTGTSVSLTFTAGTDSGSGVSASAARIKRSVAPLVNGVCGTYETTNNYFVAPTSPTTDTNLASGYCYTYQYVTTDNVGNTSFASSASVVKVSYNGAVNAEAGLLSHWRFGETPITSSDDFTETAGVALSSHTSGLDGTTWTRRTGDTGVAVASDQARMRNSTVAKVVYYTDETPSSADYLVEADLHVKSLVSGDHVGLVGRLDTAGASFGTYYTARYNAVAFQWEIYKFVNGTGPTVATGAVHYPQTLTAGQTYRVGLEFEGSTIRLLVNGIPRVTANDTSIAAAGRAGVRFISDTTATSNTTGLHLDNFDVSYPAADSKGSNEGDYHRGVTLGAASAIAGDSNTAATYDGANDSMQVPVTTGLPVGATSRTVEVWFKTPGVAAPSARQALFTYGTNADTQSFGVWLESNGTSIKSWGGGASDRTQTWTTNFNDNAWHHFVVTYDGTAVRMYVDGVAGAGPTTATRNTVAGSYGFGAGAQLDTTSLATTSYFNGSLDEMAFYTTALSASTITGHHQLGGVGSMDTTAPTGGSVNATGLVGTGGLYSTSTTLSIGFSAGTDASGIRPTGAQLTRATASLTSTGGANGICGTFGEFTPVATDPVSPMTDSVADQACYQYQYAVEDNYGNLRTYTSAHIKVDTTGPTTPTLAFSNFFNTYWSGSESTVYYRSGSNTGQFRVTASSSDAASGVASYTFPALGTNWTSTPVSPGVNAYAWSGAPAAPGTANITATNNAAATSGNAPFTLTADNTAPGAGTVTYPNGSAGGATVSVSFTTGTDGGAGIGSRFLQRAAAPRAGDGTCGTYGDYTTITNGTDPTSPVADTLTAGFCYKYQYLVYDNVGNFHTATSTNVAYAPFGAYWAFNAGTGTSAVDSSGNANTATLQAGAGWTAGRIGPHALSVNGTATSWASTPSAVVDTKQSYSVTAWVKLNTLGAFQTFVSMDGPSTSTSPFNFQKRADGRFAFTNMSADASTTTNEKIIFGSTPTTGVWYHLVGVYDRSAGSIQLYVNGVSQGTTTGVAVSTWATPLVSTNIGRSRWAGGPVDFVDGAIDEVRLYDRVLTQSEVSALANPDEAAPTGGSVTPTGLVGTGSRYSTSTTVNLTLAKGTDPSGIAASGNLVHRATGALTNGTCDAYGPYSTLVATDPGASLADTVTAGACYSYRYTVSDAAGNAAEYFSGDIKVDTTAPSAPTLVHTLTTNTFWSGSDTTVYYRSAQTSGSFTTTASASDSSGIASYAFPTLGTNWTSTPGAAGVTTYSWSGAPAAPGTKNVTATNNAGLTSANAPFTLTADDTAPSAGTVTYTGGTQSTTTVSVAYTTGTDGGSGLGTRLLQRASATLTGTTCGTYTSFATITGGTNPGASPVVDTVTAGSCYKYQYFVRDRIGNEHTATSASEVKVTAPACGAQLIANPGFESGNTSWTQSPAGIVTNGAGAVAARTGTYRAFLGGQGTDTTETLAQDVTIPANCSATLTYYLRVTTAETSGPYDAFRVQVTDNGATTTVQTYTDRDLGASYVQRTVDLSAYAGKTITLRFLSDEDTSGQTSFWLDDLALTTGVISYSATIAATTGLLNWFRLGEDVISTDTFAGTTGAVLSTRTGEVGAGWTRWAADTNTAVLSNEGRVRKTSSTAPATYYTSATPASANYLVEADVHVKSIIANDYVALLGRVEVESQTSPDGYYARYNTATGGVTGSWELVKSVGGTGTVLGTFAQGLTAGTTYRLGLDMTGTTIRLLVDGVQRISIADSGVTAPGRGAVRFGASTSASGQSDTTGLHIDNFTIVPQLVDSIGTNNGDYFGGVLLGIAGAINGDSNTAVTFDGVNDYAAVSRTVSDDFSIEFWFKSTQGRGTGLHWWSGAGLVDGEVSGSANDFGVSLLANGSVVAGVGTPDISIVSPTGYNDGAWHHVVFTRTMGTRALQLYVDGNLVGTATGSTSNPLTSPATIEFGRLRPGSNYYAGSLDEVALYNVVIPQATVTSHYNAGQ